MLQSMGALIMIETSSSADSYGLLDGVVLTGPTSRLRSGPTRPHARLLPALVYRRGRTVSACDRGLGAQSVFDPIEMSAAMYRTP